MDAILMLGTPYLLSLGLSKAQMSLVWLAGPFSGTYILHRATMLIHPGLITQPLVGAISDRSRLRWGHPNHTPKLISRSTTSVYGRRVGCCGNKSHDNRVDKRTWRIVP